MVPPGQAADIHIQAQEIIKTKDKMAELLAHHTEQPKDKVVKDIDRDYFMDATEAKEYGIVDEVLVRGKDRRQKVLSERDCIRSEDCLTSVMKQGELHDAIGRKNQM